MKRRLFFAAAAGALLFAAQNGLSPAQQAALDNITANALRGHVSFLASDLLEGRATPSRGLDIAAEYIASQFRRAGLAPAGTDGYFQPGRIKLPKGPEVSGKNVAAVIRGSDPVLRETYILVSAHYDHVGMLPAGDGDRIFNGANDNASGTAGVLEIAAALQRLEPKPRRSILFVLFFGEELGLAGSRYYVEAPLAPLKRTILNLNLEQLGRTEENGRNLTGTVRLTGQNASDVRKTVELAARWHGLRYDDTPNGDHYFRFSDNLPFAEKGIPAHTLLVAFQYPEYHETSDHWDRLDYENMAAVVKTAATVVLLAADTEKAPQWFGMPAPTPKR
jgi:Zn-dependent M28 family amino/carboxypeptidase